VATQANTDVDSSLEDELEKMMMGFSPSQAK
jgi:hypothetical protein